MFLRAYAKATVRFHNRYSWIENRHMVKVCVYVCLCTCVVFRFMKATEREIINPMWLCHEHIVCKPSHFCVGLCVRVFGWHILLLSSLPGSARGWAVGHRHHFGHVGLSIGLLSYRQHSLHCHYGKELSICTQTQIYAEKREKNISESHSSFSDILCTQTFY